MTEPEQQIERTLRRRQALRLLAASAGTAAAGSIIVSRPAFADSGSVQCRFNFLVAPIALVEYNKEPVLDRIDIGFSPIGNDCPCGGAPTIRYSYYVVSDLATLSIDWTEQSSVSSQAQHWIGLKGNLTVSVGVQVACGSGATATIRCRYATETIDIPSPAPGDLFVRLDVDNGDAPPPAGLPACNSA